MRKIIDFIKSFFTYSVSHQSTTYYYNNKEVDKYPEDIKKEINKMNDDFKDMLEEMKIK